MALTTLDRLEVNGAPNIEVIRVQSTANGDAFFSSKFQRIKCIIPQNHGTTFATGVARDPPRITITQGSGTQNAKITITHSAATEVFSLLVIGDL